MPAAPFRLYQITDRRSLPAGRTLEEAVRAALDGGIDAVQLREKDLPAAALLPLAERLRQLTAEYGAKLLINDRIDVALAVDADGVHLGGHSLPPTIARKLLGPRRLIGVSCHSLADVQAAPPADFATCGPVFFTPSKAAFGAPLGLEAFAAICAAAPLPVFALGGVTPDNAAAVRAAGAAGLAFIGAVQNAADPTAVARHLRALLT